MKTTLNIPDALANRAKTAALREGTTLTDLIVQGLQLRLDSRKTQLPLPISRESGGLVAGVSWEGLHSTESDNETWR